MIDYQEQRMKQCLRCPIGHEILKGYSDFYLTVSDGHNKTEFTDRQKEIIEKLSSVLDISGTIAEQYEILYKLHLKEQKLIDPNGNKLDCFCSLNQIISHLPFFFDSENTVQCGLKQGETLRKDSIDLTTLQIIKMILECLPTDIQEMCKENCPKLKNIENANLATLKRNKNISAIVDSFKTIFKLYCEETDILYQFCNPKYGRNLRDCHSDIFLSIAKQQKALGINELSEQSKAILEGYLKKIPKKFGAILDNADERGRNGT